MPRSDSGATSPEAEKSGRNSRRDALLFVVVFLVCTFALLVGYRYLSGTTFMDWYLYRIASDTSTVLSLVGEECRVEDPASLRDQAPQVRQALQSKTDPSTPLSSWETWRYRAITARAEAQQAVNALETFAAAPWTPPTDAAARLAFYRERLARVQAALNPPDSPVTAQPDPGIAALMGQLTPALAQANWDNILASPDPNQAIAPIDGAVREMEARTSALLERRALELDTRAREEGPRITFVYRAGSIGQIAELQQQRAEIQNNASLGEAVRQERLATADTRLQALHAAAAKDPNAERDIAFVFRVVADCGAIPSMAIFVSAVLAFPAAWRKRLLGVLIGIPVLYAINLFRLSCLAGLGAFTGSGPLFDFAHHYVWQGIYIVFVVAVWLLWVEFVVREKPSCQNAAQ